MSDIEAASNPKLRSHHCFIVFLLLHFRSSSSSYFSHSIYALLLLISLLAFSFCFDRIRLILSGEGARIDKIRHPWCSSFFQLWTFLAFARSTVHEMYCTSPMSYLYFNSWQFSPSILLKIQKNLKKF